MHLMRLSDSPEIDIVCSFEPVESLMNKHIMYKKVTNPIGGDAEPNPDAPVIPGHHTKHDKEPGWNGKNQEEYVIFLKKTRLVLMVIPVKIPSQTMHYKLVGKPGHELHKEESGEKNTDV